MLDSSAALHVQAAESERPCVQVLARIFMVRSDVGYTVRTAAVHVWKTVVTNTPRTTGEILTTLMDQIIESLGHYSELLL